MKGLISWLLGAGVAFFVAAGAFLVLANIGAGNSEQRLPPSPSTDESGPGLKLEVDKKQISSLENSPDQSLTIHAVNSRDKALSKINLTLRVLSEDTSVSKARYYQQEIERLPTGKSTAVDFKVDLSPLNRGAQEEPPPRQIIEVRATTPSGISAVKTMVLANV